MMRGLGPRRMVAQEEGEERMAREETKEEMGGERIKVGLSVNHQAGHEEAQGRTRGTRKILELEEFRGEQARITRQTPYRGCVRKDSRMSNMLQMTRFPRTTQEMVEGEKRKVVEGPGGGSKLVDEEGLV